MLILFFFLKKIHSRHTIRQLIQKWGYENANDLIVDETIDEFESTKFNQVQQTNFFNSPFGPQQNSFQFDEGYKYPNPATKVNYNKLHATYYDYDSGSGSGSGIGTDYTGYTAQPTNQR